jgi:hypothetical protein
VNETRAGRLGLFILGGNDGHTPVPVDDVVSWGSWFCQHDQARTVGHTRMGGTLVSTVFLGIDHAFLGGPPMLFETMIFGGPNDQTQERCSTWKQAEAMHARWVTLIRERKAID